MVADSGVLVYDSRFLVFDSRVLVSDSFGFRLTGFSFNTKSCHWHAEVILFTPEERTVRPPEQSLSVFVRFALMCCTCISASDMSDMIGEAMKRLKEGQPLRK